MRLKQYVLHNPDFDLAHVISKSKAEIEEIQITYNIKLKEVKK